MERATAHGERHGVVRGAARPWRCYFVCECWIAAVAWFDPALFVWLLPVAIPLLLSIPLSVYSSRVSFGGASRRFHLFQIPEENSPPALIDRLRSLLSECKPQSLSQNIIGSDARGKPSHSAQGAANPTRIHATSNETPAGGGKSPSAVYANNPTQAA